MGGTEMRSGPDPDTNELLLILAHLTRLVSLARVSSFGHSRVDDYVGPPTDGAPGTECVGQTVTLTISFRDSRLLTPADVDKMSDKDLAEIVLLNPELFADMDDSDDHVVSNESYDLTDDDIRGMMY